MSCTTGLSSTLRKAGKGDPIALTEIDESNQWLLDEMGADL